MADAIYLDSCSVKILYLRDKGVNSRINELQESYLGLQYPLMFSYSEDGYRHDVQHNDKQLSQQRKRNRVTIREFLCFRLQTRSEAKTLLSSWRLFQ